MVGNGGVIITSPDGVKDYDQPADGSEATTGAGQVHANNAAVGGLGGQARHQHTGRHHPHLLPPAGTITGTVNAHRGTPTTYTANVADNAGGSASTPPRSSGPLTGCQRSPRIRLDHVPQRWLLHAEGRVQGQRETPPRPTLSVDVRPPSRSAGRSPRASASPAERSTLTGPRQTFAAGGYHSPPRFFKRSEKKGNKTIKVSQVAFYIDKKVVRPTRRRLSADTSRSAAQGRSRHHAEGTRDDQGQHGRSAQEVGRARHSRFASLVWLGIGRRSSRAPTALRRAPC